MVDFESWILDWVTRRSHSKYRQFDWVGSDDDSSSSNSDSSSGSETEQASQYLISRVMRKRRRRRDVGKNRGCECEHCIRDEDFSQGITYRDYEGLEPGQTPADEEHFYSLCETEVKAFSLKERAFGMGTFRNPCLHY
jgi:hypothetical protein